LPLRELTTSLSRKTETPSFLYHLYGLSDRNLDDDLENNLSYADTFVRSRMNRMAEGTGDALVALHLWMYATHVLYDGLYKCQLLANGGNPGMFELGGGGMDEFIALWIGHEQKDGTTKGHSLYAMTQYAYELFSSSSDIAASPEAPTNTQIKLLYQQGRQALSFPDACSQHDENTVPVLWSVTQQIIAASYIPLMQLLLHALKHEDIERIQLYALAIIPQTSQCRPSVYKRLKDTLLDGIVNANRIDTIIQNLQSIYGCLGFTCEDIGSLNDDGKSSCVDNPQDRPLAEYQPRNGVYWEAKIDLDILQLGILASLKANDFAEYLYLYGRNASRRYPLTTAINSDVSTDQLPTSLHFLATDANRKAANPYYSYWIKYHDNQKYADDLILETLQQRHSTWGQKATPQQVAAVVTKTASFQILYMTVFFKLANSVQACNDNVAGASNEWDEAIALLVGSLEGPKEGGSFDLDDGKLFWNLANEHAVQFQTSSDDGFSLINEEMEELFYAGRAEIKDCRGLEESANGIRHLMFLPIIQATIQQATLNQGLSNTSPNESLALGEVYSLSVLPLVAVYDQNSAQFIRENMVIRSGAPLVPNGPQAVANAFHQALTTNFGYSCALVGSTPDADACELEGGFEKVKSKFDQMNSGASRTSTKSFIATACSIFIIVVTLLIF